MYNYPINVHFDNEHYWSSCFDIPEAHSAGDTLEELLNNAVEGLTLAFTIYVDQKRTITRPSKPSAEQYLIHLPILTSAKIVLWNAPCVKKKLNIA